ncbi:hypothetical protein Hanom_Chr09g00792361 [Helianthus anomalus]
MQLFDNETKKQKKKKVVLHVYEHISLNLIVWLLSLSFIITTSLSCPNIISCVADLIAQGCTVRKGKHVLHYNMPLELAYKSHEIFRQINWRGRLPPLLPGARAPSKLRPIYQQLLIIQVNETTYVQCGSTVKVKMKVLQYQVKDKSYKQKQGCQIHQLRSPLLWSPMFWDEITLATNEERWHVFNEDRFISKWCIVIVKIFHLET